MLVLAWPDTDTNTRTDVPVHKEWDKMELCKLRMAELLLPLQENTSCPNKHTCTYVCD